MALSAKAGTFTKGDSNPIVLGFQPTCAIFWTSDSQADNTWSNQLDVGYGLYAATPQGQRQQSEYVWSDTGVGTSNAQDGVSAAKAISVKSWNLTVAPVATGFNISWGSSPPSATRVHYLALGGDAQGQLLSQVIPTGLNVGNIVQVRGAGLQPSAVIAISQLPTTSASKVLGFGVADDSLRQWSMSGASRDAVNPAATRRWWSAGALITLTDDAGVMIAQLQLVGVNADGFDLQVVTPPSQTVTAYFLCVRGAMAAATEQAKSTGTAPATTTITSGFRPKAVLLAGTHQTTSNAGATHHRGFMGADDGTSRAAAAWYDTSGVSPTNAKGLSRTTQSFVKADNATASQEADGTLAMTATGATLTLTPNDAVASRFGALAFGELKNGLAGSVDTEDGVDAAVFWQPVLLMGTMTTDTDVQGAIGPSAQLAGDVTTETDWATSALQTDTTFRGIGFSTTETDVTGQLHTDTSLRGDVTTETDVVATAFGKGVLLAGDVTEETDWPPSPLALSPSLSGYATTETDVQGFLLTDLPTVFPAESDELAGTVNWHPNPSAEGGLTGWESWNGAARSVDGTVAWDGGQSIKVVTPGTSVAEGLWVRGMSGLLLTGLPRIVWSQVRIKGTVGQQLQTWTQLRYADGTLVVGDASTYVLTGAWDVLYGPAVTTNPSSVLLQAEQIVATVGALPAAATFWADGAQLEEDHGAGGPSQFAIGGYSDQIGDWVSSPHSSLTVRQPVKITIKAPGRGRTTIIESFLYRATWNNQWTEDLSGAIVAGTVQVDATRDVVWTFDATLTLPGWDRLTPYLDWVAPVLRVTKPDGTVLENQLGLYLVYDSAESHEEWGGTVKLQAFDPLWFMNAQGFTGPFIIHEGLEKMMLVRQLIDSCVLIGGVPGSKVRRYALPDSGKVVKKRREWPRNTTKLSVANHLSRGAGMYPLYTTASGIITTRPMGGDKEKRLRHREPVRSWIGNVPDGWVGDGWIPKSYEGREIVGTIDTSPKGNDLINDIQLINDDPEGNGFHVAHHIRNPNNKRGIYFDDGRVKTRKFYAPYLDDASTAQEVADALADELSTLNTTISFSVLPDPSVSLVHETVNLGIFNASGREIANGKYAVHRVTYGFTPGDCLMKIDAGLVQNADDQVETSAA